MPVSQCKPPSSATATNQQTGGAGSVNRRTGGRTDIRRASPGSWNSMRDCTHYSILVFYFYAATARPHDQTTRKELFPLAAQCAPMFDCTGHVTASVCLLPWPTKPVGQSSCLRSISTASVGLLLLPPPEVRLCRAPACRLGDKWAIARAYELGHLRTDPGVEIGRK